MKEKGTIHWFSPNTGATNESGFSALPGGYRNFDGFSGMGYQAMFWSFGNSDSTDGLGRGLYSYYSDVKRFYDERGGFSVRCVRDQVILFRFAESINF